MPFQPGQSGNPGGRPKGEAIVRDAARKQTEAAIGVLASALTDEDPRVRIKAAEVLLDRGWGKPSQAIDVGSDPERPLVSKVVREIVRPKDSDG